MASRTLLVATPGGHVDELVELAARFDAVGQERLWVTAETPHTSRVLACEQTVWVPPVGSRQGLRAAASLPAAFALLRRYRPKIVISTGAALAVPYLTAARALGVEVVFIESATRLDGPSLTGRMMATLPGVQLRHQGFRTPRPHWRMLGNVFDAFRAARAPKRTIGTVLVTLGTERFPFPRALEQVNEALGGEVSLIAQTGHTPAHHAMPTSRAWLPADELHQSMHEVDLVITHAGAGSILAALRAGQHPVILPRLGRLGEHVDDHQLELARLLAIRGLVTTVQPEDDLADAIMEARQWVTVRTEADAIRLDLHGAQE